MPRGHGKGQVREVFGAGAWAGSFLELTASMPHSLVIIQTSVPSPQKAFLTSLHSTSLLCQASTFYPLPWLISPELFSTSKVTWFISALANCVLPPFRREDSPEHWSFCLVLVGFKTLTEWIKEETVKIPWGEKELGVFWEMSQSFGFGHISGHQGSTEYTASWNPCSHGSPTILMVGLVTWHFWPMGHQQITQAEAR